jgi:hypothetical protein
MFAFYYVNCLVAKPLAWIKYPAKIAAAPLISDSLTYIFNQAITLCTFPHEWKIARVIPLFKNGKRNFSGNYRPISALPAISKIMECILYTNFMNI